MKIDRLITPEIIKDLRGNANLREIIKKGLDSLELKDLSYTLKQESPYSDMLLKDHNSRNFIYSSKLWLAYAKDKVYYFPKDFTSALNRIRCNLNGNLFQDNFFAYFQFPENTFDLNFFKASGCFVSVIPAEALDRSIDPNYRKKCASKTIVLIAIDNLSDMTNASPIFYTYLYVNKESSSLEEEINNLIVYGKLESYKVPVSNIKTCLNLVMNALLYVHSQNPEIEELKSQRTLTKSQKKQQKEKGKENMGYLPLTLVNWDYGKEKTQLYKQDKIFIDTYLRWQKCGPSLTQIKLIWVKEHEKNVWIK